MRVGFGKSDITPRLGVQLAGYGPYRNRAARELVAPLSARAMVLEDRGCRAVLLSLELCGVHRELAAILRAAAASLARCRPEDVFVSVTHTHSAPAVGGMVGWGEADPLYIETLPARAVAAVADAMGRRARTTWAHAEVPCEGIAVNRELDAGYGFRLASIEDRLRDDWRPERPELTDPTVRVLVARQRGRVAGILHHFGCHAVVYGEKTAAIHGDFVGLACLALEKKHAGATAIFLPAAMGDINPAVNHRERAESRRALGVLSRRYLAAVSRGLGAVQPIAVDGFRSLARPRKFSRVSWSASRIRRRIAALEALLARPGVTDVPAHGQPPLHTLGMEMARLEGLRLLLSRCRGGRSPNPAVNLHGLRLGPVVLLGCGLELYQRLQAPILAGSPHPHTWPVSLVGGNGYAPDAAAQRRAGYAGEFIPLVIGETRFKSIHRELPAALIRLARDLA